MKTIKPLTPNHKKKTAKLRQKKYREQEGLFLAEGINALREALRGNRYVVKEIILEEKMAERVPSLLNSNIPPDIPVYSCSTQEMSRLSTEENSMGILLVCRPPVFSLKDLSGSPPETMLYLEGVSDPGNLGTIIRTALWFGVKHIMLGPSCVDTLNTKVIRSSAGALFGVSLYRSVGVEELLALANHGGFELVALSPRGGEPPGEVIGGGKQIYLFGHESRGLSPEMIKQANKTVTIPGAGESDSLNLAVAAAIILYESKKRLTL